MPKARAGEADIDLGEKYLVRSLCLKKLKSIARKYKFIKDFRVIVSAHVLVSYCCCNNLPQTRWFKTTPIILVFWRSEVRNGSC